MARPYSVTPQRRDGTSYYIALFRNARGLRVCRGLGTADTTRAKAICAGLEELYKDRVASATDAPLVERKALELYFEVELSTEVPATAADMTDPVEKLFADVTKAASTPEAQLRELRARLIPILLDRERLHRENSQQRIELAGFKHTIKDEQEHRKALEGSMLGLAALAGRNAPPLDTALVDFEEHMRAETTPLNTKSVLSVVKRFKASLPPEHKTSVDITTDDIARFLDSETNKGENPHKQAARRDSIRRRVGRFIIWAAKRWKYPSQMDGISSVEKSALDRERGEVHYHSKDELEAAIAGMSSPYWKALVGCLGYAGLQLAEVAWLRKSDLIQVTEKRIKKVRGKERSVEESVWVLNIETVDDPLNGERHLLKTSHRKRQVRVHAALLPFLKKHLAQGGAGEVFMFPMPLEYRDNGRERWLVNTLSTLLRGHPGGKHRKMTPRMLPEGINAKSLRRTFGSLMLRAGASYDQIARAMGNTPDVVEAWYGRRRGSEVVVKF